MAIREHGLYRRYDTPPPDAAKGACYLTYSSGPGVDTGVLIDFEGDLCISTAALRELCEVAGFSFEEDGVQLEQRNAFLERELAQAQADLADANEQLTAVGVAVARAAQKR